MVYCRLRHPNKTPIALAHTSNTEHFPSPSATCSTTLANLEATISFCWLQSLIKRVFANKVTLLKRFLDISNLPSYLNCKSNHPSGNDSKMARIKRKSLDYYAVIK